MLRIASLFAAARGNLLAPAEYVPSASGASVGALVGATVGARVWPAFVGETLGEPAGLLVGGLVGLLLGEADGLAVGPVRVGAHVCPVLVGTRVVGFALRGEVGALVGVLARDLVGACV